jgi:hypothetical protein
VHRRVERAGDEQRPLDGYGARAEEMGDRATQGANEFQFPQGAIKLSPALTGRARGNSAIAAAATVAAVPRVTVFVRDQRACEHERLRRKVIRGRRCCCVRSAYCRIDQVA